MYSAMDPLIGEISYTDRKRYLWLLSVLFPLIPLVGMGLMLWTGQQWTLWIPLIFVYAGIPLLDYLFPAFDRIAYRIEPKIFTRYVFYVNTLFQHQTQSPVECFDMLRC